MAVNQGTILESLERICASLDPDEFIYQFMDAYGFPKSTVSRLRNSDDNRNVGEGSDIGVKKKLYFTVVRSGADVSQAADALKTRDAVTRNDIRFVIATDFKTLVAYDLKADERLEVTLDELAKEYGFFLPLAGYEKAIMYSEHPADLKASEKMGQLFDLIRERNDLSKPEDIHALNVFLTRLLFCFYAEDTGIFASGQMTSAIQSYTQADGSDVDQFFTDLFTVLNLDNNSPVRKAMPAHFQAFPFVNGGLFKVDEPVPEFGAKSRRILVDCASLDWSQINPDIFGSMFQAVIDPDQRGNLGQHYTSVSNIMKVIQPLFLDGLYADLEKSRNNEKRLKSLLVRLQNIKVFDPACGSGNFLIIAYKELRKLEMEVIDALSAKGFQSEIYYSGIRLNQFYGIEIDDFAHEIAMLSLWLAEHQMNMVFKEKFGYAEAALPLKDSGNIIVGNSLTFDWQVICPKESEQNKSFEVYICGNPPYLGTRNQLAKHKEDVAFVFGNYKLKGKLDYICCWFYKAKIYMSNSNTTAAFVSTNSICQGEQVSAFWPLVLRNEISIIFAYPLLVWSNNAKDKAGVHVSIIGIGPNTNEKYIFINENNAWAKKKVQNISPYLVEGGNVFVEPRRSPFNKNIKKMTKGNYPTDGGGLILSEADKAHLDSVGFQFSACIREYVGADEFINEKRRWCLWLKGYELDQLEKDSFLSDRFNIVRAARASSSKEKTRELAKTPHLFDEDRQPTSGNYIFVPVVSSERRKYIPIGFIPSSTVAYTNQIVPGGTLYEFGILTSETHNDWMRAVAGRLESRYRYSTTLVYNTFPWPNISDSQRNVIEVLAEEVLLIREDYPDKTLGELYDPDKMPAPLLEAHKALDCAVEKLYRDKPFRDASERLEHLFARYEKLIAQEKNKTPTKK